MSLFSKTLVLALAISTLAPSVAAAADAPIDWHQSFQRSRRFNRGAVLAYTGGLTLQGLSMGTRWTALAYTAGTVETVAGPMVLASSMRNTRALQELGVPAPKTAGSAGWALYGVGAALMLGSAFADSFWMNLGGWTIMSSGVILGGFQQLRNEKLYRARFGSDDEPARRPLVRRRVHLALAPQVTTKRASLALTGTW